MLHNLQKSFKNAVLDKTQEAELLQHIATVQDISPEQRVNIYRNDIILSTTEVLKDTFTAIHALVGEEFFPYLAESFITAHPPKQGSLILYGAEFPKFIKTFEPLAAHPYLSDVAQLEYLWLQSYHAANAKPFALNDMLKLGQALLSSSFTLHPSCALLRSPYPIFSLWKMGTQKNESPDINLDLNSSEDVLLIRNDTTVDVWQLSKGQYTLLKALQDGDTFATATEMAETAEAGMDLEDFFYQILEADVFSNVTLQ